MTGQFVMTWQAWVGLIICIGMIRLFIWMQPQMRNGREK
jgi:hypothetical protein